MLGHRSLKVTLVAFASSNPDLQILVINVWNVPGLKNIYLMNNVSRMSLLVHMTGTMFSNFMIERLLSLAILMLTTVFGLITQMNGVE